MTTTDKTVLALVIVVGIGAAAYQYWQVLEPIRALVAALK